MRRLQKMLLLALVIPPLCFAAEVDVQTKDNNDSGVTRLSQELRDLLSQEMRQLQNGMAKIQPLFVSGRWNRIVPIAESMEDSYVLKQSLTTEQMHELHSRLPAGFIELDQRFHYLAGMLGHAAEMEKPELIGFYYSEMTETCLRCHSQFATHKFPALISEHKAHEH